MTSCTPPAAEWTDETRTALRSLARAAPHRPDRLDYSAILGDRAIWRVMPSAGFMVMQLT